MVGFYTIVPEYIPFKEAQGVMQIMEHQFVKQGNQVYHLLENKLDTYKYSESGLEFVSSMELERDCEYLSGDDSGMLYLSPEIYHLMWKSQLWKNVSKNSYGKNKTYIP